jgi:hypothetical protein
MALMSAFAVSAVSPMAIVLNLRCSTALDELELEVVACVELSLQVAQVSWCLGLAAP